MSEKKTEQQSKQYKVFNIEWESILSKAFKFIGSVLTVISIIVYFILLDILLHGFGMDIRHNQMILFLVMNAVFGIIISMSLVIQGRSLASMTKVASELQTKYKELTYIEKDRFIWPAWLYYLKAFITNFVFKGLGIAISGYLLIELAIKPITEDPEVVRSITLLAVTNTLMFIGFGLVGMATAFDHFLMHDVIRLQRKVQELTKLKEEMSVEPSTENIKNEVNKNGQTERTNEHS